ncbi:MAG: hypothetical protein CSA39_01675 [Flavobacteriales bacterium]|nr:MAG: hypothetical protein CSA39_01675 [Flavobacteriales bacterium]
MCGLLLIFSCSTKKNTFINRNAHALTTKYNVLYNGQLAFDQAKQEIDDAYKDNYHQLLPIEPLTIEEEKISIELPENTDSENENEKKNATGFDKAEEKAIKAIQKHSMDIDGKERNPQIDDAYLLLGKSRYYSQRFVPALEAFNFILGSYNDAETKDRARIWQAKTLVRLQNEELAIETLQYLLKNKNLPLEVIEDGHSSLALAYQALDSADLVIKHLDSAVMFSNNIKKKARNLFIIGQMYREKEKTDSSNLYFERLINLKKAPYRYKIHAEIDRAKNFSKADSAAAMLAKLDKLIKDRYNRPYLDELYYQKGQILAKTDSINDAVAAYKNSLGAKTGSEFQKELTFEQLGNIYFDKAEFVTAGAYYDSVLGITKTANDKRIRRLVKKRKSLEEVINLENTVTVNDSILKIAALPREAQKELYTKYIDSLKIADEAAKEKLANQLQSTGFGNLEDNNSFGSDKKNGVFYFYNINVAGFGEQEFKRAWGNRELTDNWRLSEKKIVKSKDENITKAPVDDFDTSERYNVDYYLSRIPTEQKKIDSISSARDKAYYKLGLIYAEQFKEYELAAERLEKLLSYKPEKELVLPAKYNLYKAYANFNLSESNKYKADIVNNYPDTRFAKIIASPEKVIAEGDANSPEAFYEEVYCDYDFQHYERALNKTNKALKLYKNSEIIRKFELLKAYLLNEIQGREAFKEALSNVAVNFPNSEEGEHAVEVLKDIDSLEKAKLE